ncbi:vanadium-dependent haloperoxidase [Pontibacillus yanchengensis]|uniref:Chloroperoxidase n=1 Tax=Pontibacillus yanchengensis Y32 TaxID=1385514 RepID=A0A0A2TD53_9BACI|nr:vanadium-dependent haloperoxidase [Pontibacillus yanchengensis]KGP72026.1 chloroperoxidase [Pontibacillus yanchengensis Y32]
MKKYDYELWTALPYAGEDHPPRNPETPFSGSWNTYYIRHNDEGGFSTPNGEPITLDIRHPNKINWDAQLEKVKRTLAHLTPKEKEIAYYWSRGPATKQWTPIADILIDTYGVEAPRAGRILAALQAGINDSFVVAWYLKYKWLVARPNQLDDELVTVICTPRHPSYPSGHAAVAGTAEVILSYFFPAERRRLHELAEECAKSRLYAGVHFPIDNDEGLRLGRQIGHLVIEQLQDDYDSEGNPVDVHYRENRNANLLPPPYKQAIPYDFSTSCDSLVENQQSTYNKSNSTSPKPKLFF